MCGKCEFFKNWMDKEMEFQSYFASYKAIFLLPIFEKTCTLIISYVTLYRIACMF